MSLNSNHIESLIKDLASKSVRYIKLGEGGRFWEICRDKNIIVLGYKSAHPSLEPAVSSSDWDTVSRRIKDLLNPKSEGKVTEATNSIRTFFSDKGNVLWITFAEGRLWFGVTDESLPKPLASISSDFEENYEVYRPLKHGWLSLDVNAQPLFVSDLRGSLTKTAAYRGTICKITPANEEYVKDRLRGKESAALNVAREAKAQLVASTKPLIKTLQPNEFETLIELIFARSGWIRTTSVGGNQRTTDLDLINPITEDKAFVQVKSQAGQNELNDYVSRLINEKPDFKRLYFVVHTIRGRGLVRPTLKTPSTKVLVWDIDDVAKRVVQLGLIDWVFDKTK
jgi:hypothetical protein